MNDSLICRNFFKSGKDRPATQAYTDVWVRLINQLERSRSILSGI